MLPVLLKIALRTLGCAVLTYAAWLKFGNTMLAICAPLFGVALARPILDLFEEANHANTRAAFRDVHGRHFVYKGTPIDVMEDSESYRWLRLADVRKIVTALPADGVLRGMHPDGLLDINSDRDSCIKAEALLAYLQKATEPASLRFKLWLEREVVMPAIRIRQRN